jgi:hypothetical protein
MFNLILPYLLVFTLFLVCVQLIKFWAIGRKPKLSEDKLFNDFWIYEDKKLDKKIRKIKEVKVEESPLEITLNHLEKDLAIVLREEIKDEIDKDLKAHTSRIVGIVEGKRLKPTADDTYVLWENTGLSPKIWDETPINLWSDVYNQALDDILKAISE